MSNLSSSALAVFVIRNLILNLIYSALILVTYLCVRDRTRQLSFSSSTKTEHSKEANMPPKSLQDFAMVSVTNLKRIDSQLVVGSLQTEGRHLGLPIGQFMSASDTSTAFSRRTNAASAGNRESS
jgi:hypothetical protein